MRYDILKIAIFPYMIYVVVQMGKFCAHALVMYETTAEMTYLLTDIGYS